jgi:cytochrome c oxidase subunit 2
MDTTSTFWMPTAASTVAKDVDSLWGFVFWMSVFFFLLILGMMVVFSIRYRRRAGDEEKLDAGPAHNKFLEALWIGIPVVLVIIIFAWGFRGYMKMRVVPSNALEVKVTGQKWFWSFEYPEGATTVNELIVPEGQPVKLLMSSQDVIHSFYVPAFRVKQDVLPNRYTVAWFEATAPGSYDLFCAEYCGTKHSEMLGKVKVLPHAEYTAWLEEAAFSGEGMTPVDYGQKLYSSKACITCHSIDGSPGNGPSFKGIFGHSAEMSDGSTIQVDENYIRESILTPRAKIVAGYQAIMPTYQGLLKDREIDALVAYIKSLGGTGE